MKKSIFAGVFTLLVLVGCSNNQTKKESDFMDGWELDLSDLDLDFSKPYVQKYASEIQRDSIIGVLSQELFETNENSVGKEEAKIVAFSIDFSADAKTITTYLIANDQQMDENTWILHSECLDVACMNSKINEILVQNPSEKFVLKKDLYGKKVQLFSKPE